MIKFFFYKINYGSIFPDFPKFYEYSFLFQFSFTNSQNVVFIFLFLSDFLNYFVFLFVHLSVDVGMLVRLRRILNEKLEKSKAFATKEQLEKRKTENEAALNNAVRMVFLNTTVHIVFKLPSCL